MQAAHEHLHKHFEGLRRERGEHPVYFLEHDLDAHDVEQLFAQVSSAFAVSPFSSPIWRSRYLPLLVVATEVGYTYRGPGQDFWPKLDDRLRIDTSLSDRQALSALFRDASERLGGVTPPDTPWARNFPHIAWPITHASS